MIWCLLFIVGMIYWVHAHPEVVFSGGIVIAGAGLVYAWPSLVSSQSLNYMTWSFLPMFAGLAVIVWSYRRSDFLFSYATMMVGASLYFVVPGFVVAEQNKLFPTTTIAVACIYVTVSMFMAAWGWTQPITFLRRVFDHRPPFPRTKPLMIFCAGSLLFSAFFAWKLRHVDLALLEQSQWSGPHVIYYTLTKPGYFIVAVASVSFLKTKKPIFAVFAVIAFLAYMLPPVIEGKRDETIEVGVTAAVCWTLVKGKKIPKFLVIGAGVFCGILFTFIGTYREVARDAGMVAGVEIALSKDTREVMEAEAPEYRYQETNNFLGVVDCYLVGRWPNFGAIYWNGLVHAYVPGQIVGTGFKDALHLDIDDVQRGEIMARGMPSTPGTTFTGFADTLQAFLIFGPFVFYFIGRILRSIFMQAALGSGPALFGYAQLLVMGGVGITHTTSFWLSGVINLTLWLWLWVVPMQHEKPAAVIQRGPVNA